MTIQAWIAIALFVGGLVVGCIGWLLKRAIEGLDTKVDGACEAVSEMRLEMTGYKELVSYLRTDVQELKGENKSLRDSHHSIDKHIAVLNAQKPS